MSTPSFDPETQKLPQFMATKGVGLLSVRRLIGLARAALADYWAYAIVTGLFVILVPLIIQLIPIIGGFSQVLIMGPLSVGASAAYLSLLRREKWNWEVLLAGFDHVVDNLMSYLLFVFVQALALGIPIIFALVFGLGIIAKGGSINADFTAGIKELFTNPIDHLGPFLGLMLLLLIASLPGGWLMVRLRPFFYVLADEQGLKPGAALKRCFEITHGQFWRIATLDATFGIFCVAGLLTLGIAWLFLIPWWGVSLGALYLELKNLRPPRNSGLV